MFPLLAGYVELALIFGETPIPGDSLKNGESSLDASILTAKPHISRVCNKKSDDNFQTPSDDNNDFFFFDISLPYYLFGILFEIG